MAQPKVLTARQEELVTEKYAAGRLTGELAEEYGVHKDTIRSIVLRSGGQLRTRGGRVGIPHPARSNA